MWCKSRMIIRIMFEKDRMQGIHISYDGTNAGVQYTDLLETVS